MRRAPRPVGINQSSGLRFLPPAGSTIRKEFTGFLSPPGSIQSHSVQTAVAGRAGSDYGGPTHIRLFATNIYKSCIKVFNVNVQAFAIFHNYAIVNVSVLKTS